MLAKIHTYKLFTTWSIFLQNLIINNQMFVGIFVYKLFIIIIYIYIYRKKLKEQLDKHIKLKDKKKTALHEFSSSYETSSVYISYIVMIIIQL